MTEAIGRLNNNFLGALGLVSPQYPVTRYAEFNNGRQVESLIKLIFVLNELAAILTKFSKAIMFNTYKKFCLARTYAVLSKNTVLLDSRRLLSF